MQTPPAPDTLPRRRDLVVIGGSAGAIPPLKKILAALPSDLPAAVAIVLHVPAASTGIFATVASAASRLALAPTTDGEAVRPGRLYIAPPDSHLLIIEGRIRLGRGPRENLVRPAIDPLFRSAALDAGSRVVGVVLSGMMNDGASGLSAIKARGGAAIVQSPESAVAGEMPLAALDAAQADVVCEPEAIAAAIVRLVHEAPAPERPVPKGLRLDVAIAAGSGITTKSRADYAVPVPLTCPDCGGVLSQVADGGPIRFRCQVGHGFTGRVLEQSQEGQVDEAMRVALRIIEERADLVDRMGRDALSNARPAMAAMYAARAREYRDHADALRQAVLHRMDAEVGETPTDLVAEAEVVGSRPSDEL